ncbi:Stress protein, partial [Zea mays]
MKWNVNCINQYQEVLLCFVFAYLMVNSCVVQYRFIPFCCSEPTQVRLCFMDNMYNIIYWNSNVD